MPETTQTAPIGWGMTRYTYTKEMWAEIYSLLHATRRSEADTLANLVESQSFSELWKGDAHVALMHIRMVSGFIATDMFSTFGEIWDAFSNRKQPPTHTHDRVTFSEPTK